MFIAAPDGRLIASLPAIPESIAQDYSSVLWREGAAGSPDVYVSQVHPRLPDNRMTTDIVGAVRTQEGAIVGYLGVSVLVERIGRRLSSIDFADQSICQVLDQTGMTLFTNNFVPNTGQHFTTVRQPHSGDSPEQGRSPRTRWKSLLVHDHRSDRLDDRDRAAEIRGLQAGARSVRQDHHSSRLADRY